MNKDNNIKIKLRQSLWLMMACFCVVFSGAVKKVLQLRADEKISLIIPINNSGARSCQNLKDGHRERHEVQELVPSVHKKSEIPGHDLTPCFYSSIDTRSPHAANYVTARGNTYAVGNNANQRSIPTYLFIHRLQV